MYVIILPDEPVVPREKKIKKSRMLFFQQVEAKMSIYTMYNLLVKPCPSGSKYPSPRDHLYHNNVHPEMG